jgi:preprotein translocase subunit SecD
MYRGMTLTVVVLLVAGLWLAEPGLASGDETEPAAPAQVTFSLNMPDVPDEEREGISARTVKIFLERLLGLGLPDPSVFRPRVSSIRVAVPPDADLDEVVATLAGRGLVEFREQDEGASGWKLIEERAADGTPKPLTSAYFKPTSVVTYDPASRQPQVAFELNEEGAVLMEAASRRLVGKPMGIFYDGRLVIAPIVRSVLRAQGVIGGLAAVEAKRLVVQLNSGALPVDVTVEP